MSAPQKDQPFCSGWHWGRGRKMLQVLFPLPRENRNLSQTQNTFLRCKALCGQSKHFISCGVNDVLRKMLSPGNSTFALSPAGRRKPTTVPVPEPRSRAMTRAKARQEKRSAAVCGLHRLGPLRRKRGCKRALWYSWRRRWDLFCGKCGSSLVMDSSRCLQIPRGAELCAVYKGHLPRGLGHLLTG